MMYEHILLKNDFVRVCQIIYNYGFLLFEVSQLPTSLSFTNLYSNCIIKSNIKQLPHSWVVYHYVSHYILNIIYILGFMLQFAR